MHREVRYVERDGYIQNVAERLCSQNVKRALGRVYIAGLQRRRVMMYGPTVMLYSRTPVPGCSAAY